MRDYLYTPILLLLHLQILLLRCSNKVEALDADTDKEALLSFKSMVFDPQRALSGWTLSSSHCTWFGVTCSTNDTKARVSSLELSGLQLSGMLPIPLSNLTSLQSLILFNNSLYGPIPMEFSQLTLLQIIVLAINSINGSIPSGLSLCSRLKEMRLFANQLSGSLPFELGDLKGLEVLDVAMNNLSGSIPSSFGNLSSLTSLALARNNFSGRIPDELGDLQNLVTLQLSENQLTGRIPDSIFDIPSLMFLSLTNNNLSGEVPSNIGKTNLEQLFLANNEFGGVLPSSLSNASRLQVLDLSSNNFQGSIPMFSMMKNLVKLHLGYNNLSSTTELNLKLIESLSNCTLLEILFLNSNKLAGEFPSSVANLSIHLKEFCVDNNFLTGIFPQGFMRFQNLTALAMHQNSFRGQIPSSIGELKQLRRLMLQRNRFYGEIPDVFGNLTNLYILALGNNQFSGTIPSSIGKCEQLSLFGLAGNRLEGRIPREIFGISGLRNIFLSGNNLSGLLPLEIGQLTQLEVMDVSSNKLSGDIPTTIGKCVSLHSLIAGRNNLVGSIPEEVGDLRALESLDLSFNNLSGHIPKILENLKVLSLLNLSFNDLEGPIPTAGLFINLSWDSLQGNENLCGSDRNVSVRLRVSNCGIHKKSNEHLLVKILAPLAASISLLCSIFLLVWALISHRRKKRSSSSPSIQGSPHFVTYAEICHATNSFAEKNLVGKGGFGSVYKAEFSSGEKGGIQTTLAVKVLELKLSKADKSFNAECEALRNVRHRNLVKVLTSCSSIDNGGAEFKALVMEFMSNGNLGQWLYHEDVESGKTLSLNQRLSIAIDVASAMDYLHNDCDPPLAHCDLKPGNVLLDDNMVAHVGDFGLARFLSNSPSQNGNSSTIGLKGSIGYIPPEYGLGGRVTTKGDVYSFGILLLEIFTAKKSTDELFQEGMKLSKSATDMQEKYFVETVDPRLMKDDGSSISTKSGSIGRNEIKNWHRRREECLAAVIRTGLSCAAYSAKDRIHMREALRRLKDINTYLQG